MAIIATLKLSTQGDKHHYSSGHGHHSSSHHSHKSSKDQKRRLSDPNADESAPKSKVAKNSESSNEVVVKNKMKNDSVNGELKMGRIPKIKSSKDQKRRLCDEVTMLDNGRVRCDICLKSFTELKNLYQHQKTLHMGNQNISCQAPDCKKKFKCHRYLRDHMRKSHGILAKMIPSTSKSTATKKSVKTKPSKKVIAEESQNVKAKSIED